ncbi:MAG: hypothetical protein QHI48_04800 [Bacteroidota bacterium]|nr:hypothetical protein [Bacteroidota bacterium]
MNRSRSHLFVCVLFRISAHAPFIPAYLHEGLRRCLYDASYRTGSRAVVVENTCACVRLLLHVPIKRTITGVVSELRRSSREWLEHRLGQEFAWQGIYTAYSIRAGTARRCLSALPRTQPV